MKLLILTVVLLSGVLANNSTVSHVSTVVAPSPSLHITSTVGKESTALNKKSSSALNKKSSTVTAPTSTAVSPDKTTSIYIQASTSLVTSTSKIVQNDTKSSVAVPSSASIEPSSSTPTVFSSTAPMPKPKSVVDFKYPSWPKLPCINVSGNIHIQLQTEKGEHLFHLSEHFNKTSGTCMKHNVTETHSAITIIYYEKQQNKTTTASFTMKFQKNDTFWYLSDVNYDNGTYVGHAKQRYDTNDNLFSGRQNNSYMCNAQKPISLISNDPKKYNLTVMFESLTIVPFPWASGVDRCPAKTTSKDSDSIVPIAVGCALAGLIVIVLIAYLIGRRKGNNRGYQQV